MKFCIKCGSEFEQETEKYRKHCFVCIPQGQTQLNRTRPGDVTCEICSRPFLYNKQKRNGSTKTKCPSCSVNANRQNKKNMAIAYKGGCCQLCGYNKCARSLTFHHIDEKTKSFGISGAHARSWEVIRAELDKCILVCQNCHCEIHDGIVSV